MSRERTLIIRNTSRRKICLYLKPDIAERARKAKIVGMHVDEPLFVLGDRDGHPTLEAKPEVTMPEWLWEGLTSFKTPKAETSTQGKTINGWLKDGTLNKSFAA